MLVRVLIKIVVGLLALVGAINLLIFGIKWKAANRPLSGLPSGVVVGP